MYPREKVIEVISSIIHELFEIPPEDIQLSSRLKEDLDLDSIDAVDLIVKMQEFVGKRINPEEFKNVRTIEDVVATAMSVLEDSEVVVTER